MISNITIVLISHKSKEKVLKFMLDHNFKLLAKENTPENLSDKFIKTFNYRFEKNDK